MRHCSFFGPLLLVTIGGLILWHNIHPEFQVFDWFSQYWPFLLIGWGLLPLAEVLVFDRQGNSRADAQSIAAGPRHVWRSAELGSEREIQK
jgi:hypothetical protein